MPDASPILNIPDRSDNDLFEILDYWVETQPDALLFTFLDGQGNVLQQVTYRQFSEAVDSLAEYLQSTIEADRGARVLLSFQPGLEIITALFACNKAGFVGVPTLPLTRHQQHAWLYGIKHILHDSQAVAMAMCTVTATILDNCEPDAEDDEREQKTDADLEDLDLDLSDVELSLDIEDDEGSKK